MKKHKKQLIFIVMFAFLLSIITFATKPIHADATILKVSINTVYHTSKQITGVAGSGSTVSITISGNTYKVKAASNGKYVYNVDKPLSVGTQVKVSCNSIWYTSNCVNVQRDTKISIPTVDPVTSSDTEITGVAENANKVMATIGGVLYTGVPDAVTGEYTIKIPNTLKAGTRFTVQSKNDYNYSGLKIVTVTESSITLEAPTLEAITDKDVSVKGIAKDSEVVYLTIGSATYEGYPDDTTGAFTIDLNKAYASGTKVEAYGKKGATKSPVMESVVIDSPKTITAPTMNTVSSEDKVLTGTADPNVKVIAEIGTDEYQGYADSSGKFSLQLDKTYSAGTYVVMYAMKDGEKSSEVVNKVVQGEFLLGINMVTDNDGKIDGKTIANATIKVQINDRTYSGIADDAGNFQVIIDKTYKAGQNIEIIATDPLSNRTERKYIQIYPTKPTINTVLAGVDSISGKASSNAYVIVSVGGKDYGTFASASGYYFVSINPNDAVRGAKVEVFQISQNIESAITEMEIS